MALVTRPVRRMSSRGVLMTKIEVTVDGSKYADDVEPRMLLVHYLRERLGKTGTVVGCDTSNCGACTVHLDGKSVKSCNVLAVQADGHEVTTIEGLAKDGELHPVQKAFHECHALQCGYCTPGMIMQSIDLLNDNPNPSEEEIREGSRATSAAAPATTTSSRPCRRRAGGERLARARTTTQERPPPTHHAERSVGPPPQGGPAPDHRAHPLDRQHRPARDAAPGHGAQPLRARADHQHRRERRPGRPNVVAVLTGADLATSRALPSAWPITPTRRPRSTRRSRSDRVTFAGEIVAVVVARNAAEARDAAELVDVDYDELPPVLDLKEARRTRSSPTPTSAPTSRRSGRSTPARPAPAATSTTPSPRPTRTAIVIEREYRQQRLIPAFMEPRSMVVDPTGEQITIWSATQIPHILRFLMARRARHPREQDPGDRARRRRWLRRQAADHAGGVDHLPGGPPAGQAVQVHRDPLESLMAAHHGRDQWQKLTLSAKKDGTVTGLKVELLADMGAYISGVGGGVPVLGAFMFNAIYKFPVPVRGPDGAHQQDLDRRLPRRRPARGDLRHRADDGRARRRGRRRPAGDPRAELDQARGVPVHHGVRAGLRLRQLRGRDREGQGDVRLRRPGRAEQKQRRETRTRSSSASASRRSPRCAGCALRVLGSLDYGAGGWEHAAVRMLPTGKVEVITGVSAHGQGHETAWSQIVADRLGVAFEDVEVLHGDTQIAPKGLDTYGSRSLVVGGEALVKAADKVIEKAKPIAAHLLEASDDDLEFAGGQVQRQGHRQGHGHPRDRVRHVHGAQPPRRRRALHGHRRDVRPGQNFSFPHGTHLCAVEVDTETGGVKMRKYVAVDDIGNIVNPLIVAGQVHGGLVQGIAQALFEEADYDEQGTLVTASFVDYLVPTAADHPSFDTDHTTPPTTTTRWAPRASARPAPSPRPRPSSTRSSTRSGTSASTTCRCRARRRASGGRSTAMTPGGYTPTPGRRSPLRRAG